MDVLRIPHALQLTADFTRDHPGVWDEFYVLRRTLIDQGATWPDYVWSPNGAAHTIFKARYGHLPIPQAERMYMGRGFESAAATLSAWRLTQGIYRFDDALREALLRTRGLQRVPVDAFQRMPAWSVYVECPGLQWKGQVYPGFFATMLGTQNFDQGSSFKRPSLLLMFSDYRGRDENERGRWFTDAFELDLGDGDILASVRDKFEGIAANREQVLRAWGEHAAKWLSEPNGTEKEIANTMRELSAPLSLLLYLCADNRYADIPESPERPSPKKVKGGERYFPPSGPTTWDVGFRIGAVIRKHKDEAFRYDSTPTGRSVRPHVRNPHWHSFRYGPRTLQVRPLRVHWLHPIFVKSEIGDALPAVIRPVKE